MFNPAIDSKLRSDDLVSRRVRSVTHGKQLLFRAVHMGEQPVTFLRDYRKLRPRNLFALPTPA